MVDEVGRNFKSLWRLQLYIMLLNMVNQNLIFTWKLFCIGSSSISGYAAIVHFKEHPIFGVMYYVIFFDCTITYKLPYKKGFKVSGLLGEPQTLSMLRANKGRKADGELLKRQLV